MRFLSVLARLLGIVGMATIRGVTFDEEKGEVVVSIRPHRRLRNRCGKCGRKCSGYDQGDGRRRWRCLDVLGFKAFLEADAPRVECPAHDVVVAQVPWADHGARFTREFEDLCAWLAVECSKTAVSQLLRIDWHTVGAILVRACARASAGQDRLAGLRRIGIDEISWRRGQRYIIVVIDHDAGRLVWAAAGRDRATLRRFFDELGEERCKLLTHVSADGADWIRDVAQERSPQAALCLDPFHVVKWATEAVDDARRQAWNAARHGKQKDLARDLKGARWVLWKGGERLTARQRTTLAWVERMNQPLYTAYLLKEHLRLVFQLPWEAAVELLIDWMEWAWECGVEACEGLGDKIADHIEALLNTLRCGLSNARLESMNTRLRLITRRAFGFHSAEALMALALLSQGGVRPALPWQPRPIAA